MLNDEPLRLRYEDWEGVIEKLDKQFQFQQPPEDYFPVYRTVEKILTLTQDVNWKVYLLTLNILHLLLIAYLNYRQSKVLRSATKPKTLQNLITDTEFSSRIAHEQKALKLDTWSRLYHEPITILVIQLELLPNLWVLVDKFIWNYLRYNIMQPYNNIFGHPLNTPLFYLTCAILWTIILLPYRYIQSCLIPTKPPTPREWISNLAKEQFYLFIKIYIFIFSYEPEILERGVDAAYNKGFNNLLTLSLLYILYTSLVLPFLPPRWLKLTPLQPGKTRTAIENLAKKERFPLDGVYTWPDSKRSSGQNDIVVFGPVWSRGIAIFEDVLENCDTKDIAALTIGEMRNWMCNPLVQLGFMVFYILPKFLAIWFLLFNWNAICTSFGFGAMYSFSGQHPFQIVVLILGGALDPAYDLIYLSVNSAARVLERKADKSAVEKGHGKELARAVVKMKRGCDGVPVSDWMYQGFCFRKRLLSERLKDLGWTGEEELTGAKDEKFFDHWEDA